MAETKKSLARINFVDGGRALACSGTLINTERFPAPYFTTAHHCVNNQSAASSITTLWFYEDSTCSGGLSNGSAEQVASGAELVMTNYNLDSTLLLLNAPPPPRAVYSGWNAGGSLVSVRMEAVAATQSPASSSQGTGSTGRSVR